MLDPELLAAYNEVRTTPSKEIFCHAPFTSMNFAQNGDVTVCCYNRKYVLGTYPADSLEDMWHGERAQHLRDKMSRNELPRGCDLCLSQFWSRNFGGLKARFYDQLAEEDYGDANGRMVAFPKVMEFEISNVCNLECTMCNGFFSSSIRHNREKLPPLGTPYDDRFIAQLEQFIPHLTEVRFLGGEPFLIRAYYQIWDMLVRLNPDVLVSITTNATILNDRIKAILERLRGNIVVSIDSLERESYERIRVNAKYDDVMEHLAWFKAYVRRQHTQMTLAVCPMRQNWRHLPQVLDFCNDEGVLVFFNTVIFPGEATFRNMSVADLDEVAAYLSAVPLRDGHGVRRGNNDQYRDLIKQIAGYRDRKAACASAEAVSLSNAGWTIGHEADHAGTIEQPDGADGPLRVRIDQITSRDPWAVQLLSPPVSVKASERYVLQFRARADSRRPIVVGAGQNYPPWTGLGLCIDIGLSTEWQRFELDFVPTADEENGYFYVSLGDSLAAVELADITLRAVPAEIGTEEPQPEVVGGLGTLGLAPKPLTFMR